MRLEKIVEITQGIPLSRIRINSTIETEERTVYSFENESSVAVPKLTEEINQNIPLVEEDMILLNLTSYNAKKAEKTDLGKVIPSNYIIIKVKNRDTVDPDYLEWYIDKSESFKRELHKIKQGSIIMSIPINEFRKINIKLPNIEFQRKLGKVNSLNRRRKQLFLEREELLEKLLITVNEEEMING
ncbi:hypothetical protein FYJ27_04665 [Anaerosalibacter bizertensis]|uniref:Restriction endonuclease subunit S n=1 Tax=Anaerosalibacter bizertensis TaxID=932217 RepID=A0A844FG80_9FIRM|nr:hypothetical protein [Anaerosalibacter bizertensis]MSS43027.1 hypothetical protein [Anaerosalibacter bizertensis]